MPRKGYRKPKDKRLQSVSIEKRHVDLIDFHIARGERTLVHQPLPEFLKGPKKETDNPSWAALRRYMIGLCIEAVLNDFANENIALQVRPYIYGTDEDHRRAADEINNWRAAEAERIMETAPAPVKAGCLIGRAERLTREGHLAEAAQVQAQAYQLLEEWRAAGGDDD